MFPIFANPAGLWMLLGLPAILAIHFLQQRARVARTSTWFLIEKLAPDSARGRTWDRLRSSRTLWLQLLAVLIAAWVLGDPRWIRAESAQTVVIVLDASAAMDAFRAPAVAAAEREMNLAAGLAARTTWVVMTTNPRQPALYRGLVRDDAAAALPRWQPDLGRHDLGPALRLARTLAGVAGRTLLITDSRAKAPADQRTTGVGHVIDNVGFAGATIVHEGGAHLWRALVKNHATTVQRRTWQIETGGAISPPQPIELAPGALSEISARLPEGAARATVVLSDDGFGLDNRLPLMVPRPKPLTVGVEGTDDAAEFFRKLAAAIDGVTIVNTSAAAVSSEFGVSSLALGTTGLSDAGSSKLQTPNSKPSAAPTGATLRIARLGAAEVAREPRGGIFWPPADQRSQAPLLTDPVTPERDPLMAGLNWQGWFGAGPHGFTVAPGDLTLLWHGRWPLVFVRSSSPETPASNAAPTATPPGTAGKPARKLMLAFDWATSNASRLPATVLLGRRFLELERDQQRAPYAANFDCGALIPIAGVPFDGAFSMAFEPAGGGAIPSEPTLIPPGERTELRAPGRAGFFTVRRETEVLVQGAAQFADARQGDFRAAERFFNEVRNDRAAALERNTTADPFVVLWMILLAAVVLWSWWTPGSAGVPPAWGKNAGGTPAVPG